MRNRFIHCAVALMLLLPQFASANEGMWLVSLLNRVQYAEMNNLGLNLTAEEIYSINQACLKDAVVRLNGGSCTGEVVSDKGLIFTNHHCAYDAIQTLSTVQNDLLTNGFCAKSIKEELPIPDFNISFLIRIEDVTAQILGELKEGMSEGERAVIVRTKMQEISGKAAEGGKYQPQVKEFFYGNEYYLFVYQTFNDIRLVGNPPESVGKYGGDTDNWMWPRHTGDFSMIRVYAGKDNNPADYAADNVPYKPKHFFPINIHGIKEGDFAMIMGYPGSTDRYLSSWGVKQALDITNPSVVEIRDLKLKTMKEHMDADPAVRLKYAAKYAQVANYWKYFIGQNKGLVRLDVYGKKKAQEERFTQWVNKGDATRKNKYGRSLGMIEEYYKATDATAKSGTYALEAGLIGADLPLFAFRFSRFFDMAMKETDEAKRKAMMDSYKENVESFFKDYDAATEKDVFVALTKLYMAKIAPEAYPGWIKEMQKKYKGNVEAFAEKLYSTSFLADKAKLMLFLEKPSQKVFDKDMAVIVGKSMFEAYIAGQQNDVQEKFDVGYRQYVAGLREMNPEKEFAPDANSTMRLTYGVIDDYIPADAVHYDYYTTARGIMEKRDNSNPEFVVPDKLAEMINKKDYGRYANENGEMVTCFIANLDITGGNSGSPVLDGNGNLIGIAFDGNWEAMSGDIAFEPELQRTIAVDIRYVMWVVEKLMGGTNIVNEVKFAAKPERKPVQATEPAVAPQPAQEVMPAAPAPTPKPAPAPAPKPASEKPKAKPGTTVPVKK